MKTVKFKILILLLSFCSISLAQEFEVPQQVKLEKAEDYAQYNAKVIEAINWLENTPVQEDKTKRKSTSAFLMQYMTGTPDFTIEVLPFQLELTENNPDLLMSFLGGWSRFALENPSEKDNPVMANKAGIKSILKVYEKNKGNGIKKDRKVEKLLKMEDAALEKWIVSRLGK